MARRIRAVQGQLKVPGSRAGARRMTMSRMLRGFVTEETGQDLIEYALLTSFLAIVSIVGLKLLGAEIKKSFSPALQAL
jgi:Flp pilus assembly pilin Flp